MTVSLFEPAPALSTFPPATDPRVVFEELMEEIRYNLSNRPRDLQKQLGPSEIGEECDRALIAKLFQLPEPKETVNWRAWVGSCMHNGLETILAESFMNRLAAPRFLLESRVDVGQIGPPSHPLSFMLSGSCDVFDILTGGVWDWKSKSATRLKEHRRHGMGQKYRVQFHSYGLGMENAGHKVNYVGGIFMLRDGELSDSFALFEPYDRNIALAALERANRLFGLGVMFGPEVAMGLFPPCTTEFCRRCGNYKPPYSAPRAPRPANLAAAVRAG